MPPSYRDERSVVEFLLRRLEQRLAGRDQPEVLKKLPSDQCQLGVLAPWDVNPERPEASEEEGEEPLERGADENRLPHRPASPAQEPPAPFTEEMEEPSVELEPSGVPDEATRHPPSAMGCGLLLQQMDRALQYVQIAVTARFCIYTRYFPSYREELRELGRQTEDTESDRDGASERYRRGRNQVTLVEKFRRHDIEVGPIRFDLDPTRAQESQDEGTVRAAINEVLESFARDQFARRRLERQVIPVEALETEDSYYAYLRQLVGDVDVQPLDASIRIIANPAFNGLRVGVYLCNATPRDSVRQMNNHYRILGDARITVSVTDGVLVPIELLPFPDEYRYDRRVFAIGRNTSVTVSRDRRTIRTTAMGRYDQPRTTTSQPSLGSGEPVQADYTCLADDPFPVLHRIAQAMREYAQDWRERIIGSNELALSHDALAVCESDLEMFERELDNFCNGIAALSSDANLRTAFCAMNRALSRSRYSGWRLFQIVYIVTQLPALVIREGVVSGEWPGGTPRQWQDILDWADVLWFPTGGGKTEAYLGLISCAALYDRLRGKERGLTSWLKFPLRMLSVQQLQRAIRALWYTELERRRLMQESGRASLGDPISLGYFVGKSNTPNRFEDEGWSFDELQQNARKRDKLLLINDCPACGGETTVQIQLDPRIRRVKHVCTHCNEELPVYVTDEEIYRFLPTLLIGTVDKIASIAYQRKVAMLIRGPEWRCPVEGHGYGSGEWCVPGCPTNRGEYNPQRLRRQTAINHDPAPSLHVQDELHLLQEELGAFAGHYETMLRASQTASSNLPPKVIAATATIEGYEHQCRELFGVHHVRRFPNRGYDLHNTFYTAADPDPTRVDRQPKVNRIFTAFRPPYLRAADAATLCGEIIHQTINELQTDPYGSSVMLGLIDARTEEEIRELLSYYSKTLTYVGKRDSGIRISQALEQHGSQPERRLRPGGVRDLNIEYLSSHSTLREIAEAVKRAEASVHWASGDHLDATVATDVISHGVDVEFFNLMILERIPEQTGAYIQVSSRSGRQHVGLVLAVLPRHSLRASSIYDRFPEFHRHLDRMVTPVPINRFARSAVDKSFPGVALGTL